MRLDSEVIAIKERSSMLALAYGIIKFIGLYQIKPMTKRSDIMIEIGRASCRERV